MAFRPCSRMSRATPRRFDAFESRRSTYIGLDPSVATSFSDGFETENLSKWTYVYFEEAFPAVVSRNLTEEQIWFIHEQAAQRWGLKRFSSPMPEVFLQENSDVGD
jgi:hypothetical protein